MLPFQQERESNETRITANFDSHWLQVITWTIYLEQFTQKRRLNSIWQHTKEYLSSEEVLWYDFVVFHSLEKKSNLRDVQKDSEQSKSRADNKFSELSEKQSWEDYQSVHLD